PPEAASPPEREPGDVCPLSAEIQGTTIDNRRVPALADEGDRLAQSEGLGVCARVHEDRVAGARGGDRGADTRIISRAGTAHVQRCRPCNSRENGDSNDEARGD